MPSERSSLESQHQKGPTMTEFQNQVYEDRRVFFYIGLVLLVLIGTLYFTTENTKSLDIGVWQSRQKLRYVHTQHDTPLFAEEDGDVEGDGHDSDSLVG